MAEPMRIGPIGRMIEVRTPPAVPASLDRPSTDLTLVNGQRVTYRAPRSSREWSWDISLATDDDIDDLITLEQGVYGPPPWRWYDPMAAATNMLPDVVAAAGVGPQPYRWFTSRKEDVLPGKTVVTDAGKRFAASLSPRRTIQFPFRRGVVDPVPVIPGRVYTGSLYLADGTGYLAFVWSDADGDVIQRDVTAQQTGRMHISIAAPALAAGVSMELSVGTLDQAASFRYEGYAVTPGHASLDITGDIDVRVGVALDQYDVEYRQVLVAKYLSVGNQRGYEMSLSPGAKLALTWSQNGTGSAGQFHRAESTLPVPALPGVRIDLRVNLDVSNVDGVWEATFMYRLDNASTWTQLGDIVVGTLPTVIFASSAALTVGVGSNLLLPAYGDYFFSEVRSGVGGTLVASPNFGLTGPWVNGDNSSTPARADSAGKPWLLIAPALIVAAVRPILGSSFTGCQLTETPGVVQWRAGMGMPHVQIAGIKTLDYRRLTSREKYRDVSVTLKEQA